MSIREILEKIKAPLESNIVFVGVVLTLVSVTSFCFGRLSVGREHAPISIEKVTTATSSQGAAILALPTPVLESTPKIASTSAQQTGAYVASKKGTKYHLPWCSGAKRISDENKVWFTDKASAEAAGYTPASNCPGM